MLKIKCLPSRPVARTSAAMSGRRLAGVSLAAFIFAAFSVPFPAPAWSAETGLASALHRLQIERGNTCMSSHFHHGVGSSSNARQAFRKAVANWQSFTKLEYGEDWAQLRMASEKSRRCSETLLGWTCYIKARPCRRK